jgi:N6-adenosine-specific RNA methylase IME4/DNA-binding XRE family transcriptional regulator
MKIDKEFQGLIPPLTPEEYAGLEQSILTEGCRDALITWNDTLIDGHNRYEICTKHNILFKMSEKVFESREKVKEWIILNQFGRRNLSAYDRSILALRLKELFAEKARGNMSTAGGDRKSENAKTGCQISDKAIDTKKELAKVAGVSHDTIAKVQKIEEKATPEIKKKIKSGEVSINQAYNTIKYAEKEEKREGKRQENQATINGTKDINKLEGVYQTILLDPPWDWSDEGDINQLGRAKPDYTTMSIVELYKLPVGKLSDDNCHLYLWVTNRSLPKAFKLIEQWGFRYITCITWVKPSFGMGNYFRGSTEQLLFAVKGSQPLKRKDVGTHFFADRGKYHSSKPDCIYDLIESCSYGPYLELFSRNKRENWTMWGESYG